MGKLVDNRLDQFNTVFNLSSTPSSVSDNLKQTLQYKINDEFQFASDVYTIQEEQTSGKLDWQNLSVRITHVLSDKNTSDTKKSDDWRNIIFKDITHYYALGIRYQFDSNTWITVQSDIYHYPTASAIIRRCDSTLKWYDTNHTLIEEPVMIDYDMRLTKFLFGTEIILPQGHIKIYAQYNSNTQKISMDQRFVLGSQLYKIDYINDFIRKNTYDKNSVPLIYFTAFLDQKNLAVDDMVNQIANGLNQPTPSPTPVTGNYISPSDVTSILQGTTQQYSVFHYVDSVSDTNTFAISSSGALNSFYTLNIVDGNHFEVTSLGYTSTKLLITCTNNTDQSTIQINITLKGLW